MFALLHCAVHYCPVEPSKDQIKAWLKKFGRDREWLAKQTFIRSKRTVDNWLSSPKEIPEDKLGIIARLMSDDEAEEARRRQQLDPVAQVFSIEVDLPTFRAYGQAAKAHHLTIEEWAIAELNAAADEWLPLPPAIQRPIVKATDLALNEAPKGYAFVEIPVTATEKALIEQAAQAGNLNRLRSATGP